jgi:hypothetical protein
MILENCLSLDLLCLFFVVAFDLAYQSSLNVNVIFPGCRLAEDNLLARQTPACFGVHDTVFLFRSKCLGHDSESLVQSSEVILDYHSLSRDFGVFRRSDCEDGLLCGFFFSMMYLIDVE